MTCSNCINARDSSAYQVFDPLCLYCGARYFQHLRTFKPLVVKDGPIERFETKEERTAWMGRVLDAWAKQGHDRTELRGLAMADVVPYEPVTGALAKARTKNTFPSAPPRAVSRGN